MIGDALDPPRIIAAPSFVGLGVFSTDEYVKDGGLGPDGNALEWYVNTARFYSQIRNFKMDITATAANASIAALHYQVAQATSLEHVEFIADSSTTQQAIFAENGSGGVMSDLTFTGGKYGICESPSSMHFQASAVPTSVNDDPTQTAVASSSAPLDLPLMDATRQSRLFGTGDGSGRASLSKMHKSAFVCITTSARRFLDPPHLLIPPFPISKKPPSKWRLHKTR